MSHYEIDYSGMTEPEKHNKAIQDIKDYLGESLFEKATKELKMEPMTRKRFKFGCALVGIQCYPMVAWWNHINNEPPGSNLDLLELEVITIVEA